jgi:hypothetical protein
MQLHQEVEVRYVGGPRDGVVDTATIDGQLAERVLVPGAGDEGQVVTYVYVIVRFEDWPDGRKRATYRYFD